MTVSTLRKTLRSAYFSIGMHEASQGTLLYKVHNILVLLFRQRNLISAQENPHTEPLNQIANGDCLRILSLCGIGDVLWSLVILPAVLKKYNKRRAWLIVHDPNNHRSFRSTKMLERFELVAGVEFHHWKIHKSPPVGRDGHLRYTHDAGPGSGVGIWDYNFIINSELEHGLDFVAICKKLSLDPSLIDYDVFRGYRWLPADASFRESIGAVAGEYAVFYLGALVDNTAQGLNRQGLWSVIQWVELAKAVLHNWPGLKIVVVGATYDIEYFRQFARAYGPSFYKDILCAVGLCELPETIAIIREARFVIGFASGIPISSVYLGVRTGIFWRPQHLSMSSDLDKFGFDSGFATSWVPPEMLQKKRYLDLWYTVDTPETIISRMLNADW